MYVQFDNPQPDPSHITGTLVSRNETRFQSFAISQSPGNNIANSIIVYDETDSLMPEMYAKIVRSGTRYWDRTGRVKDKVIMHNGQCKPAAEVAAQTGRAPRK